MLTQPILDPILRTALTEDLSGGDLSAESCVDEGKPGSAVAISKAPLVVCGSEVFRRVFELVDSRVRFTAHVADGTKVAPRTTLWSLEGPARSLLMGERTALNFVQRMSGTATLARACVDALPAGSKTRITDTRKTTPGLRALERYAVRAGGAFNHRNDLGSAVMIKDNHIVAAGGITAAVEKARARAPHTSKIEVEVTNLEQLEEALATGAEIVMLDNFDDELTKRAVERVRASSHRPLIEASGGITLERIGRLATIGVDIISVGALTHSAPAADISLDFQIA